MLEERSVGRPPLFSPLFWFDLPYGDATEAVDETGKTPDKLKKGGLGTKQHSFFKKKNRKKRKKEKETPGMIL